MRINNDKDNEARGDGYDGRVEREGNRIYFYSGISPDSISRLHRELDLATQEALKTEVDCGVLPDIHLHILSYGGWVDAGFAAADLIINNPVPVRTVIEGCVASAGTFLSCSGSHRVIRPHGTMLIHQLSSWMGGAFENLKDEMTNLELSMGMIIDFYRAHTDIKEKKLRKILKKDLWFTAEKCLDLGLVDEIA
jgi:ATP-dependent protease ClpP protease subunit